MKLWKSSAEAYRDAIQYIEKRKVGEEQSLKTPWSKFNNAIVDGIEWNSTVIIGGRPGSGKTLIQDQIVSESFDLNPDLDHHVLKFSFEMPGRTSAIREFSSITGKTYKELCSVGAPITDAYIDRCKNHARKQVNRNIQTVYKALTVEEIENQIDMYLNHNKGKKTLITLDHTVLVKLGNYKSRNDMLYALGEMLTNTKRIYPISFLVMSQLNRNIEDPDRAINGKYGNYILDSDIFGADAMLQHADTLIGVDRPAKRKIRFYGPDKFIIQDDKTLVFHFLKTRQGENQMSFFKAKFENMKVEEMNTPPCAG